MSAAVGKVEGGIEGTRWVMTLSPGLKVETDVPAGGELVVLMLTRS